MPPVYATKKEAKIKPRPKAKNITRKRESAINKLRKTMKASRMARVVEARNPRHEINERIARYKTEVRDIANNEETDSIQKLILLSNYIERLYYKLNNHPELGLQDDIIVELDASGIAFNLEAVIQKTLDLIGEKTTNKNSSIDNISNILGGLTF